MTNRDLVDAAWAKIVSTSISGSEWQKRVTYGYKGKPYDWRNTDFGRAKLLLEQIVDVPVVVDPPSVPSFPNPAPLPSFAVVRTVVANTQAELLSAISAALPGDLIQAGAFSFTGQLVIAKTVAGAGCRVVFDPGFRMVGTISGTKLPSVYIKAPGWQLIGGDFTSKGNNGIRVDDVPVLIRGTKIHDCAGTGLIVQGLSRAIAGVDIEAEIWNCGLDLSLDPHVEKGTGNHAAYIGQTSFPVGGKVVLDVHDQPYGAALQCGGTDGLEVGLRARRCTFVATTQVGGNGLQLWNSNVRMRVPYLDVDVMGGRAVEAIDTLDVTVEYGRASNTRLAPWPTVAGVVYVDVNR